METKIIPQFRRKFPRRAFNRGVGILFEGKYEISRTVEIGEGGVSFRWSKSYPIGKDVVLNFQIPFGKFVSVRAEIKNASEDPSSNDHIYGCVFKNLKFDRKREVRAYVSARDE